MLDRAHGRLVHHLQTGRNDARSDDRADRRAGLLHVVEGGQRDLRELWLGAQLDGDLGDHRQQAFAAANEREQIVAGAVERFTAELDNLACDEHAPDSPQVVHGESVFEAVHAAGVLGDVAGDRARDLRRRIGGEIEAIRGGRLGNREIAHAGLHDRGARKWIDGDDPPEFREREHDPCRVGQRPSGQAGSRAARDDGDARLMAGLENRHHLRLVLRQYHGTRLRAIQRESVAFVRPGFLGGDEQRGGREDRRELRVHGRLEHRLGLWRGPARVGGTAWCVPHRSDYFTKRPADAKRGAGKRSDACQDSLYIRPRLP